MIDGYVIGVRVRIQGTQPDEVLNEHRSQRRLDVRTGVQASS
jgi:hypothetical protein